MGNKETLPEFVVKGRALILAEAEAMYHALGCTDCGLRFQGLLALALVGWSEAEFVTAEMASRA